MATRKNTKSKSTAASATKEAAEAPEETPNATEPTKGAEAPQEAPTGPETGPTEPNAEAEAQPEIDPITKLETQREDARKQQAAALAKVSECAASGDLEGSAQAMSEATKAKSTVDALTRQIAETGFGLRIESVVREFFASFPKEDIPGGNLRLQIVVNDQEFQGVRAVSIMDSGKKSSKAKGKKKAALSQRDRRLPPAGLTLPSQGGDGRGPCQVTYTDGSEVIVSGPCADGTVLTQERFTSVSGAGKRVTGNAVNGYVWAQLGGRSHSWCGHQVNRDGTPVNQ